MILYQKIKDVTTFSPYSAIQECFLECKRSEKEIDEYASYICLSLINLMKSNNVSIEVEKIAPHPLENYHEQLMFKELKEDKT